MFVSAYHSPEIFSPALQPQHSELGKKEGTERKRSGDERATQEIAVTRRLPAGRSYGRLAQGCRDEPGRSNLALPWAVFGVPRWSFREHGPCSGWQREDPQGQSPRSAYARSARLSRAGLFIPPRKTRRRFAATSLSGSSGEKPQLRRRQRPVMRGSAAAVSWRHHRQERSKFQMSLMPRK